MNEGKNIAQKLLAENSHHQGDPIETDQSKCDLVQTDQSESLLDLIESCDTDSENSDLEYNPGLDTLNFGEIEDEKDRHIDASNTCKTKHTQLEFKVIEETPESCDQVSISGTNM